MRTPETRILGGHTYQVTPLPAGRGLKVLARVAPLLGGGLANLPSGTTLKSAAGAALKNAGGAFLAGLLEQLDGDLLTQSCQDFAEFTQVGDGTKMQPLKGVFDLHFQGDYFALYEWFRFAVEVNFGPLAARLGAPRDDQPAASPAPPR